ncbi:MAG: hypothetical protein AB7O97_21295 [Planctomycetota bacterium]
MSSLADSPAPARTRAVLGVSPAHLWTLLAGAALCVAAAVVGELRFGSSLYLFADVKDKPGAFQGSMTALSGFLLVAGAVLLLRAGELLRRQGDPAARGFVGAALLLAVLAFDEVVMLHEWFADKCAALQLPRPLGIDHDLYVFAVYGLWALLCGFVMLPTLLRHRDAAAVLGLMVLFAAASEAVDFVPWDSLSIGQRAWLGPVEEGAKFLATLTGALYAHALLDAVERRRS